VKVLWAAWKNLILALCKVHLIMNEYVYKSKVQNDFLCQSAVLYIKKVCENMRYIDTFVLCNLDYEAT
jgi:hypothetical protein